MSQTLKNQILAFFNSLEEPQQMEFLQWIERLNGVFVQTEKEINVIREELKPILRQVKAGPIQENVKSDVV